MFRFIWRRLVQMLFVIFALSILTFSLSYFSPSDPIERMTSSSGVILDQEVKEQMREELGLNDSFFVQYGRWVHRVLHGDLGDSIRYNMPVWQEMKPRLIRTSLLAGCAFLIMILIALPLGIWSACSGSPLTKYLIQACAYIAASFPTFWLGMLLLYWLGYRFHLVNVLGTGSISDVILPAVTLAIPMAAGYIRILRTAMLEEFGKKYVFTGVCRGLTRRRIICCHVIPNALLTILPMAGMSLGNLFGGTAVIEAVFNWQGVGYMAVNSVQDRDYNMIQGYALWMGIIYVGLNLIVDILEIVFDPRKKYGGEGTE